MFGQCCAAVLAMMSLVAPLAAQPNLTSKQKSDATRLDQYGDPLPPGAIARIGSSRFRQHDPMQVVFAKDGKALYSTNGDGLLVRWDLATGRASRSAQKRFSIALSPDGRTLAATDNTDVVHLLDPLTLEVRSTLKGEPWSSNAGLAFSPDGGQLATSSGGTRTLVWDIATGKKIGKVPYAGWVLAFSRDGKWLTGTGGHVLDMASLKYGEWHHGRAFAFSPCEDRLAAGHTDGKLRVFDVPSGKEIHCLAGHEDNISAVAYSPDGKTIASGCQTWSVVVGSRDEAIRLWDAASGELRKRLPIGRHGVRALTFSHDGRVLAAAVEPYSILLWDAETGRPLPGSAAPAYCTGVAFSPDGKRLAVCGDSVRVHDPHSGKDVVRLGESFAAPPLGSGIAFAADGRYVAAANGRLVRVWDVAARKAIQEIKAVGNDRHFQAVALAPGGSTLATAGQGRVCLFAIDSGKKLHELEGGFGTTVSQSLAFSPDGGRLATGHVANRVLLWDARSGKYLQQIGETSKEITHGVTGLAFFPDGRTLATAGDFYGYTLHLHDTASDRLRRRPLQGHTRWVAAMAVAADGKSLVSAGWDGTLRLWEVATGKQRALLTGPSGIVGAVAFAGNGRHIASVHQDGTALVWDLTDFAADKTPPSPARLEELWTYLGDLDAAKAFQAICTLTAAPDLAIPFLKERVRPTAHGPAVIRALIADLGDKRFTVRDKATRELERFDELADAELERALEGKLDLETRRRAEQVRARVREKGAPTLPDWLRAGRVVEILWRIGTPQARELLELWARDESSWHGTESRAVLDALRRHPYWKSE